MFDFDVIDVSEEAALHPPRHVPVLSPLRLDTPVADIPRGPAITLAPGTAVASALAAMRDRGRSGVVVVQNHRPVGVVTDRDVLGCLRPPLGDLRSVPLSSVMTACTQPLRDTDTVAAALRRMCTGRQWHQPIVCRRGLMLGALDVADLSLWLRDGLTVMSVDACLAEPA
jgi:predicted transcriptional regulator